MATKFTSEYLTSVLTTCELLFKQRKEIEVAVSEAVNFLQNALPPNDNDDQGWPTFLDYYSISVHDGQASIVISNYDDEVVKVFPLDYFLSKEGQLEIIQQYSAENKEAIEKSAAERVEYLKSKIERIQQEISKLEQIL